MSVVRIRLKGHFTQNIKIHIFLLTSDGSVQVIYCYMHNNYGEAVAGNGNLGSQAPSINVH